MQTILFVVVIIICALFLGIYLWEKFVWGPKQRREAEAAPRITLEEAQSFWTAIDEDVLPIAKAHVQERGPLSSKEARIGGAPLAIGDDKTWPRGIDDGLPLIHIVQINFADVPPMESFPTQGVLQVFSPLGSTDDIGGSDVLIRWDPDPQTIEVLDVPEELRKMMHKSRDFSEKAVNVGLPLEFSAGIALGNPYNWPHEENDLCYQNRLPESDEVGAVMDDWEDRCVRVYENYGEHWVGGHPQFVQTDFRSYSPQWRHIDRVLFHLGCDGDINLGDSGELNVMISNEALLKREFQKAYSSWDCA